MTKVVAYLRCSTEGQAINGVSLAVQREKVEGYAKLYGLDLIATVEDAGLSAKTLDRPGLTEALALLDKGEAEALLVMKLDRLTRSVRDLGALIDSHFSEGKADLMSVQDQIDTRSAAGRLVLNVLVSVAQWERETISERTRSALSHKKATGKVYGHTPFGFDRADDNLVPNAAEQAVIERIKALRVAGVALGKIADAMNADGAKTKNAAAWTAMQVKRVLERAA